MKFIQVFNQFRDQPPATLFEHDNHVYKACLWISEEVFSDLAETLPAEKFLAVTRAKLIGRVENVGQLSTDGLPTYIYREGDVSQVRQFNDEQLEQTQKQLHYLQSCVALAPNDAESITVGAHAPYDDQDDAFFTIRCRPFVDPEDGSLVLSVDCYVYVDGQTEASSVETLKIAPKQDGFQECLSEVLDDFYENMTYLGVDYQAYNDTINESLVSNSELAEMHSALCVLHQSGLSKDYWQELRYGQTLKLAAKLAAFGDVTKEKLASLRAAETSHSRLL